MSFKTILAAVGMLAATIGVAGSADAQRRDHDRGRHYEQRGYHRDYRHIRHDRGHHYGRDRHCRTVIRHHHRVRVCR